MATFDVGLSAAGYFLRLTVTEISVDVPNNRSTVSWSVAVHKGSGTGKYSGYVSYWSVNIGGIGASGSRASYDFRPVGAGVGIVWGSGSTTLDHNPDGTLTIGVSGSFSESVALIGNGTASGSLALTTIPRASTPTFSPNPVDAGTVLTITSNRASGTFTHEMDYAIGAATGSIGTGIGASTTWTPPLSLLNQLPNSTSGLVNVTTRTYSGATLIGTTVTSFTLAVPTSIVPDFGTITNSEGTAGVASAVGAYVQGVSTLVLAITSAIGAYNSTISSYKIEVAGQTINAISGTTALPIATSGTVAVVGTVTDSRGRTHSETVNVTVLAYAPPVIDAPFFLTRRSDVAGVLAEEGTSIRVDLKAAVQSLLVAAVQKNALNFKIYTRLRGDTSWTLKDTVTPGGITYNSFRVISTYAIDSSWDVRVDVYDLFSTSSITSLVPTSTVFMEWAPGGFLGLGKFYESGRGQMDAKGYLYHHDGERVGSYAEILTAKDAATEVFTGVVSSTWTYGKPDVVLDAAQIVSGTVSAFLPAYDVEVVPGAAVILNRSPGPVWTIVAAKTSAPAFLRQIVLAPNVAGGWLNYDAAPGDAGYTTSTPVLDQLSPVVVTKSSTGWVMVTGYMNHAAAIPSGSIITTLPVGFRPAYPLTFPAPSSAAMGRTLTVNTDGTIVTNSADASPGGWGLGNILFNADVTMTALTLSGAWVNYGGTRRVASIGKDSLGLAFAAGTIKSGSITPMAVIAALPSGYRPPAVSGQGNSHNVMASYPASTTGAGTYVIGNVTSLVGHTANTMEVTWGPSNTEWNLDGLIWEEASQAIPWIAPQSFLNGWSHYDAFWNQAGFYKRADGLVQLRGLVKGGTVNAPIFKLPEGYRPIRKIMKSGMSTAAAQRIDVQAGGDVILVTGANTYVSLDGIMFAAAR